METCTCDVENCEYVTEDDITFPIAMWANEIAEQAGCTEVLRILISHLISLHDEMMWFEEDEEEECNTLHEEAK